MCTCNSLLSLLEYKPMDETFSAKMKNKLQMLDSIFELSVCVREASSFRQTFFLPTLAKQIRNLSKIHREKISIEVTEAMTKVTTQYKTLFVILATWSRFAEDVKFGATQIVFLDLKLNDAQRNDFVHDLGLITINGLAKSGNDIILNL
jgi:hypothetical protein